MQPGQQISQYAVSLKDDAIEGLRLAFELKNIVGETVSSKLEETSINLANNMVSVCLMIYGNPYNQLLHESYAKQESNRYSTYSAPVSRSIVEAATKFGLNTNSKQQQKSCNEKLRDAVENAGYLCETAYRIIRYGG